MQLPTEFAEKMKKLLGSDYELYEKSLTLSPKRAVNVNIFKISPDKAQELYPDFLEPCDFSENCLRVAEGWAVGNSVLHHAGALYVQEPGAMLPVLAAPIREGMRVLDLCASPGGKTVQAALKVGKSGSVVANEIDKKRAVTLLGNVERMGFDNVIVTNCDSYALSDVYDRWFDAIIVDAPCSGEGMFRKNPAAMSEWSAESVLGCAARQREILTNAVSMLAENGILVYSTCTFSPEENEQNVAFAVNGLGLELIRPEECVMSSSVRGLDTDGLNGEYMRRVYPHCGVGEGQFFAVMRKPYGGKGKLRGKGGVSKRSEAFEKFAKANLTKKISYITAGDTVIMPTVEYPEKLRPMMRGIKLGEVVGARFVPDHNLYSAGKELLKNKLEVDAESALKYLRGEEIVCDTDGYTCVTYCGVPLGGGKASGGMLKNHYPKGLRLK